MSCSSFGGAEPNLQSEALSIQTRQIEYGNGVQTFKGLLAWDDALKEPRPGVLVAHTIRGRTAFEEGKARDLAALGFAAFALDVYGASDIDGDEARLRGHMDALIADRDELQKRLMLSLSTMQQQQEVDAKQSAAIGFCFGGLCVLDLARLNAPLAGVVSFHGLFKAPGNIENGHSNCKVLALHGWDDPMATPDAVLSLAEEMTALGIDWQLHGYGNTKHAFTNPAANDSKRGTVYHAAADRRSWIAAQNFLTECFD